MGGWSVNLRLAWRDLQAQGSRSVFFLLLVAVGVASLVGVQGVAESLRGTPELAVKQMAQGDVVVSAKTPNAQQQAALSSLAADGAVVTEAWELPAMAKGVEGGKATSVEVKGIDPSVWPLYGMLKTNVNQPLSTLLASEDAAAVGSDLTDRLHLKVGDRFQLSGTTFRIAAVIKQEPLMSVVGRVPLGPRVLIRLSRVKTLFEGAESKRFLVKLPTAISADQAKERLQKAFPGTGEVTTYSETWQTFSEVMAALFTFLSMVAFVSLLIGGLGVAISLRSFISQKMEHIAILKSLGATSGRIMAIFLLQALFLGVGGSLIGVLLGLGMQAVLPMLFAFLVPDTGTRLQVGPAVTGFVTGVAISLICTLLPVRAVRIIKPMALFRSETGAVRAGWKSWIGGALTGVVVLAGLGWMASLYARSATVGFAFLGALAGAALLLLVVGWGLLLCVRLLPQSGFPTIRHAVRSLYAPGSQAKSVVVAMGFGVMLMSTIFLLQNGLMAPLKQFGLGADMPNLFLPGVSVTEHRAVETYLRERKGVTKVSASGSVPMSLVRINGKAVDVRELPDMFKTPDFPLMESASSLPAGREVLEGSWFAAADQGKPLLVLNHDAASMLGGLHAGSTITLRIDDQEIDFHVQAITARGGVVQVGTSEWIATAPGALANYATNYWVTAKTDPAQEAVIIDELYDRFPRVMPLGLGSIVDLVDGYVGKMANLIRFMAGFAVLAAVVILSGSLSATRFRRRKEAALLKTLGATRAVVAGSSALENGLLGAVAGLAGGGLAYGMIQLAAQLLKAPMQFPVGTLLATTAAGALFSVAVGFATTLDVLQIRPLSVLRSE